jgi:hypothetical protein
MSDPVAKAFLESRFVLGWAEHLGARLMDVRFDSFAQRVHLSQCAVSELIALVIVAPQLCYSMG